MEKKNLLRTEKPMTLNLGKQHRVFEFYQVCSNNDPGFSLTYFMTRLNWLPYAFVCKKGKTMDVSETIVVYENEYMNLYEYQRSFIDLGPVSLIFNIFKLYFLRMEPPRDGGTKVYLNGLVHKTIMAAMHIYGKKTQTNFFS